MEINLDPLVEELKTVTDDQLRFALSEYELSISDDKFHHAFSAYGLSNFLSGASLSTLASNTNIPGPAINAIRWNGVFVLRGYIAMVYMRSDHLERGLDNIPDPSPISPFKRIFRAGSMQAGDDTIAQHIRNSFSHGSFELSDDMQFVTFTDRQWSAKVKMSTFINDFCEQVVRLYMIAFQIYTCA